jgi:hypothetical protein
LAKHLQTSPGIWDDIDLISLRVKEPPQNLPQSRIVLNDQNPFHWSRSQFAQWSVQGCCQGGGCHNLFLFLLDRRLI